MKQRVIHRFVNMGLYLFMGVLLFCACGVNQRDQLDVDAWGKYWFQGTAEISSFDLTQYRYGEPRKGEAVLIFVTEDLSEKKQVKLDWPEDAGRDAIKVLKLNMTKNFVTGIYPYSMMLSVFSPVFMQSNPLKLTASSQEWCGQSFTQLNLHRGKYRGKLYSYFEEEGDMDFSVDAMPEDHLWNLIRFGPDQLPLGQHALIPGLLEQRFSHVPLAGQKAVIRLKEMDISFLELGVEYLQYGRHLKILFEKAFPYHIVSFEEVRVLTDGTVEKTVAERKAVHQIDYWNRNKSQDIRYRKELQLAP